MCKKNLQVACIAQDGEFLTSQQAAACTGLFLPLFTTASSET